MILINLPQFPYRGIPAPYLWMFYKFLSSTGSDLHFLIHQDYLAEPSKWIESGRWELHESSQRNLGYDIPSTERLERVSCSLMPDDLFEWILGGELGNPLKAYERVLSDVVPDLVKYYSTQIESLSQKNELEAILSPINCPSLREAARKLGIPIIYFELGPLRGPNYIDLAYFDFQGLNEAAEFADRFVRHRGEDRFQNSADILKIRNQYLRGDWWLGDPCARKASFDIGVSLQIEDDSNLIASSKGFTNQALIAYSKLKYPGKRFAYRAHPGSFFDLKQEKEGAVYSSGTDFIFDCNTILTINSSMGFEALLWGKQVNAVGDAPYKFILTLTSEEERNKALCFYLENYLVPFELIFNLDYIRFRLSKPLEINIKKRHITELIRIRSKDNKILHCHETQKNSTFQHVDLVFFQQEKPQSNQVLTERDVKIAGLNQVLTERDVKIAGLNQVLTERDVKIADLNQVLTERDVKIADLNQVLTERDVKIADLNQVLTERDVKIADLNQVLTERDVKIADLNQVLTERDVKIADLNQVLTERDVKIAGLNQVLTERDVKIAGLTEDLIHRDLQTRTLDAELKEEQARVFALITSRSWRITKPFRFAGMIFRKYFCLCLEWRRKPRWIEGILVNARRVKNLLAYIARGDLVNLRLRLATYYRQLATKKFSSQSESDTLQTFSIMTPKHTIFVAELISQRLQEHGWSARVLTEVPTEFSDQYYIVLCPQVFSKLPPGEKRIVYQLEQSVSSRWFTSEYFATLNNSLAVLEYSLINLSFLSSNGISYPHVNYLPIGATTNYGNHIVPTQKKYDILFYGDSVSSPRRRKLLDAVKSEFCVHIVNECFGDDMVNLIKQSRVVLNLHYYEDALLEMPRIQECISLGIPVVSESSRDQGDYPEIDGGVLFFEQGSIASMLEVLRKALGRINHNTIASVHLSQERFNFMFDRFLVAMGFLSAKYAATMKLPLHPKSDTFGLSLPETINRRRLFDVHRPSNCVIFDGIRRNPGWIGCGLSYSALANHANRSGLRTITVMEDDVILPTDYQCRLKSIRNYLDHHDGWDIFVGVIASLHKDTKVLSVEKVDGYTYVTIDRMTSTVFNIYGKRSLDALSSWNPEDHNSESNTIDQFLGNQVALRVVVTLPFFVGHREDVYSSLWGFKNTQYRDMISSSEILLHKKVMQYIKDKGRD